MKKTLLSIACLSILFITQNVDAQLSFAPAVNYGAGTYPMYVTSADFNTDGKKDLAVANFISDSVSVLLGSGTGSFVTAFKYKVGVAPSSVTSSDFNGDGKVDLALTNAGGTDVSILLGNGTGSFGSSVNYVVGSGPRNLTAFDFNGDGNIDLATANQNSNNISILLGNGTGSFASAVNYAVPGSGVESVICADFNKDNKIDLATANPFTNNVSVLLGNGNGTFGTVVNFATASCRSLVSADFNGDLNPDLAVANYGNNTMAILLGNGAGSFAPAVNYPVGNAPYSIVSRDFDKDGKVDLALANSGSNDISVLVGSGTGTFSSAVNYNAGSGSRCIVSADFNNDGSLDLVTANLNSHDISVFLNTTPFAASLNFDGVNDDVSIGSVIPSGSSYTKEAWIYANASGSCNIISSNDAPFWLMGGKLSAAHTSGGSTLQDPAVFTLNQWVHVAVTYDATSGIMKLYKNGSMVATSTQPTQTGLIISLGQYGGGNRFKGSMDEVRVWNTVRTQCEINTYKDCEIPSTSVGLIANYHFNQGIDAGNNTIVNTLTDVSGFLNTGTLNNFALTGTTSNWIAPGAVMSGYSAIAIMPIITVSSGAICAGDSYTIVANGALTYTSVPALVGSVVTPTATTNYNITGTDANGCTSSVAAVSSVTVNALPTITVSSGAICAGNSYKINANGATSYTSVPALTGPIVTPTATTDYSITGTDANGCVSSNTAVSTVTVNALPTVSVTSGAICAGQSYTMIPSGANTYTYSSGSDVVAPTMNTSYNVTGTDVNGCVSSNTAISSVTVNALPTISVNSGAICTGNSFTMVPSGANTYSYSSGSAVVTPIMNTSYNVTGTDAQGCVSSNTAVCTVTVNALPTVSVTSGAICPGQSFTMVPSGANTYSYSSGSAVVTPTMNTSYNVTGTDANGCVSSNTAVSTVTVNNLPTISVNSGSICTGQSFTMTPSGASTYTYSNGSAVATPTANASYNVTGTDVNGCISSSAAVSSVTVNALPMVMATTNSTLLCTGQTASLTASGATSYTWNTSAISAVIAVSPTTTVTYTVNGTDANGCSNVATITQNVSACTSITTLLNDDAIKLYPNPNNGLFTIELTSLSKVTVTNALGQIVISETFEAGNHNLDIINQSNGVYFVKVIENNKQQIIKVIKQ